ncbi:Polygalacturonase inhibitor 1 [Acorus calamus]|uniref:Polygalacturonase inhibitor 1 n=1 Tax=Acorus calamus TaxID=4465 RepID=A0AAV9BZG9_ACOCL|nr:Polygalacturonase inhibitor 1 [Acorus calamus]
METTHMTFSIIIFTALLTFSSLPHPTLAGKCNKDDKVALLSIQSHLGFNGWQSSIACCDWSGVFCDADGRVNGLGIVNFFSAGGAAGTISPAIGDLPFLQELFLHKLSYLVGEIPRSLTRLQKLTTLGISWTNVSGPVPAFLSEMKSLNYLDLSFNNLTGPIPASLGTLPNLNFIHLDRNRLTGPIPASLGNLPPPLSLFLSHNMLSGSVPTSLGEIHINTLDISRNQLVGDPSFLFGASKPTDTIIISRNLFKFDLTGVEFPVNLTTLDMSHNMIYGEMPKQMTKLNMLQNFNGSYNRLCGEIPQGGRVQDFDQFSFFHNSLKRRLSR